MATLGAKARLYVESDLGAGIGVQLPAAQAHYVNRVMRLRVGDAVALFNGRNGEWLAEITETGKARCSLRVTERTRAQAAEPDLWLAFAPIKKTRLDYLVEKATELGASRLCPVFTQHTAVTRINVARMRAHAMEAAEQCGRLSVPVVAEPLPLSRLMADWPAARRLFVLDETGTGTPIAEALGACACGFLIGPEGGFAHSELDALRQLPFACLVGLGPRILRADTAALAALACWQALIGDRCQASTL